MEEQKRVGLTNPGGTYLGCFASLTLAYDPLPGVDEYMTGLGANMKDPVIFRPSYPSYCVSAIFG